MNQTRVEWQTASPLWEEALKDKEDRTRFQQPVLLRFATDSFMEDLEKTLSETPSQLKNLVARYETWEDEVAGWLTEEELAEENTSLKLYQPAHSRFYLVAASLVCHKPGLPDKCIHVDQEEKISFVLRRLVRENGNEAEYGEYGWNNSKGWQKVDPADTVSDEEERLPMFTMNFKNRDRQRCLLTGFIPAASRETFQAPGKLSPLSISNEEWEDAEEAGDPFADMGMARFEGIVVEGFKGLWEMLEMGNLDDRISDSKVQEVFLFCLLDFVDYVEKYLNSDFSAIAGLDTAIFYENTDTDPPIEITWLDALQNLQESDKKEEIRLGTITDLGFIIPGLTTDEDESKEIIKDAIDELEILDETSNPYGDTIYIFKDTFNDSIKSALDNYPESEIEEESLPEVPKNEPGVNYVIRCVYERPRCKGIHVPVVSQPSRKFQLATYFEPEAPTRPIRITMPKNTSIAGLRKFKKNVSVLFSDKLRNQMEQIKDAKLADLDDGDISTESGFSLGMICSLSIPIITICAMILLMIIVKLLNIIFWWMPFFKICFPIIKPGKD